MTSQERTLTSVFKLPENTTLKCCKCGVKATSAWPGNSKSAQTYCDVHLEEAQTRLLVALGASSAIAT